MTLQLSNSSKQLLQAIDQLDSPELERVANAVNMLRAKRIAPSLPKTESDLVRLISSSVLSTKNKARLLQLGKKMETQEIVESERKTLIDLSNQSEQLNVQRMKYVGELATLRGEMLLETMNYLGLLNTNV